jgi:Mg-chelatase subunit ChlD
MARSVQKYRRERGGSASERAKKALEAETGQSMEMIQEYRKTLRMYAHQIEEMDEFFDRIITKRLAQRRRLSQPSSEGIVLDPALLAQTHVDVQAGVAEPSGLLDYEITSAEQELIGGYDLHLLIDTSGSMEGEKSLAAAHSAAIFLEGFNAFSERVDAIQAELGVKLDLDIATSVLEFGDYARILKPLTTELTERQRIQTYVKTLEANGSATEDYSALEEVLAQHRRSTAEDPERPRKNIVVVVTDGGSSKPERAKTVIEELRRLGVIVIGIGITDTDAEELYSPFGRTISDPKQLPNVLIGEIERVMERQEGGVL